MDPKKRTFDTNVQLLKYKVLRAVADFAYEDKLDRAYYDIPKQIIPGKEATMRCCIYKERAIVTERVRVAMGGNLEDPSDPIVEVLDIACDECPVHSFNVTGACRGCIAHRCVDNCPVQAITIQNHHAVIDHDKCIECGRCLQGCPYNAIIKAVRPCEQACKVGAIKMDPTDKKAHIDRDKCTDCGACVYQCPFGAVMDKSYIVDTIEMLKNSENNTKYKTYAIIAPAIVSQFSYAKIGQVVTGIRKLGFHNVIEVALGADMVAHKEAAELVEKGFLTSSCCPAFVAYIHKHFPNMAEHISHNLSPMAELARFIKKADPQCKVVFIGPCTAKKQEIRLDTVRPYVDCAITFEELQALLDSREICVEELEESPLDNASYYGRIFARSGGVSDAVAEAIREMELPEGTFELKAVPCDGIEECKVALLKAGKGLLQGNFIEGMACQGGCINGAGCITHGPKNKAVVDKYGNEAMEKTINGAIRAFGILEDK